MNDATQRQISESESKLSLLLREIKGGPIEPRVQLWIGKMCGGRKLTEYLNDNAVAGKEKLIVARNLVEILLTHAYDRLPEVPVAAPKVESVEKEIAVVPEPEMPAPDEIREMIRAEVRNQLAGVMEMIAAALRETK